MIIANSMNTCSQVPERYARRQDKPAVHRLLTPQDLMPVGNGMPALFEVVPKPAAAMAPGPGPPIR
jgi:hypothetical protein